MFWFLVVYWAISGLISWKNKKAVIYHIIMIPLSTFFIVFLDSFKSWMDGNGIFYFWDIDN